MQSLGFDNIQIVNQRGQRSGVGDRVNHHRFGASADRNFLLGQTPWWKAGGYANRLRKDRLTSEALCQVLQSCCDVDRVTECREHHVIAVADVADDDLAAMNADTEADRLMQ